MNGGIFENVNFDNVGCSVFWKDNQSVYLGCNNSFANVAGYSCNDLVGKSDYNLPWGKTEANSYRKLDADVINHNKKLTVVETQLQANGNQVTVVTSKFPLWGKKKEISGVLGCYWATYDPVATIDLVDPAVCLISRAPNNQDIVELLLGRVNEDIALVFSEIECLSLWVYGCNINEISMILARDEMEIFIQLNNIKSEMKLENKLQIIDLLCQRGLMSLYLYIAKKIVEANFTCGGDTINRGCDYKKFSRREIECLYFLSKGKTVKCIARALKLSPRTVETYLNNIKTKYGVAYKSDILEKALLQNPIYA